MAARVGALLIAGSFVFWAMIPFVPLVGLRGGRAGVAVASLMAAREIVFWIGVLLVGRESWVLARRHGLRGVPTALWRLIRHGRPAVTGVSTR
jgi:hypothetical protein